MASLAEIVVGLSDMTDTRELCETEVIKLDRLGRNRYTEEFRAQAVDGFEQSGMTGMAFARELGVKYQTFVAWVKKRRDAAGAVKAKSSRPAAREAFLLAEIREEEPPEGLSVSLPGGAVVHATSREQLPLLVELLKALSPERC